MGSGEPDGSTTGKTHTSVGLGLGAGPLPPRMDPKSPPNTRGPETSNVDTTSAARPSLPFCRGLEGLQSRSYVALETGVVSTGRQNCSRRKLSAGRSPPSFTPAPCRPRPRPGPDAARTEPRVTRPDVWTHKSGRYLWACPAENTEVKL